MTLAAVVEDVAPLTANKRTRGNWANHHAWESMVRDLATSDARTRRGHHGAEVAWPCRAWLVVTPTDQVKRDLDGYAPVLKRMLDGTVLAKWIPDDNSDVVVEVSITTTPPGPRWRFELHLIPTPQEDRP